MSPEQQLLVACSRTRLSPENSKHILDLVTGPLDWAVVLEMATAHRVLPLVDLNLPRSGAEIPSAISTSLREQVRSNALFSYQSLAEMQRLTELLRLGGVPCACLKGPALAASAYGHFSLRQSADVDILVRRGDLNRAIDLLLAQGYSHSAAEAVTPTDGLLNDSARYHLGMVAKRHSMPIELHWGIGGDGFAFDISEAAWTRLRPIPANGGLIFVLPVEEELLSLCLHGARHLWSRLGWICDIAELTQSHPSLNWSRLLAEAKKIGCQRMLLIALTLAKDLLGCGWSEVVEREVRGDPSVEPLAKELVFRLFNTSRPLSEIRAAMEMHRFYLRFHERFRDQVKYGCNILRPTEEDFSMISLPPGLRWLYYPIRPVRLVVTYVPQLLRDGPDEH